MWDVVCIVASLAFFATASLYTSACERLAMRGNKP